jgi:hypothetical protein
VAAVLCGCTEVVDFQKSYELHGLDAASKLCWPGTALHTVVVVQHHKAGVGFSSVTQSDAQGRVVARKQRRKAWCLPSVQFLGARRAVGARVQLQAAKAPLGAGATTARKAVPMYWCTGGVCVQRAVLLALND